MTFSGAPGSNVEDSLDGVYLGPFRCVEIIWAVTSPRYVSYAVPTNMMIVQIPIGSIWRVFNVTSSGRETIGFSSGIFTVLTEISDKNLF